MRGVKATIAAAAAIALGVAAACLVGCTVVGNPPVAPMRSDDVFDPSEPPPAFAGPYAAEFSEAWRGADLAFVRDVLYDESISDEEWAEVGTRMESCFAQYGMTFLGFEADGSYGVDPGEVDSDRTQELLAACEAQSGERWLSYLRDALRTNPENRDFFELVAACLVAAGAVAQGYEGEDYRVDIATGDVPLIDPVGGRETASRCNADPLDLIDAG